MPSAAPQPLPDDARILIVRFSSLGDVVKCSALPRLIRRRYPRARITFLTSAAHLPLVRGNPHLERAIGFPQGGGPGESRGLGALLRLVRELRAERYHLVVDVHRSLRSRVLTMLLGVRRTAYSKRTLQRWLLIAWRWNTYRPPRGKEQDFLGGLAPYGVTDDGLGTEVHLDSAEVATAAAPGAAFAADWARIDSWRAAGRPVLGIAPVAAWALKRWPLPHVRALLERYVATTQGGAVLFGGPDDAADAEFAALAKGLEANVLVLAGRTTHLESAAFARACDVVLCNDTGMSHIAEAVGRDVVVLFGPTTHELGYFPVRPGSRVLERDLPCRPCTRMGEGRCTHPWPRACLAGIEPGAALAAVLERLEAAR